MVGFFALVLLFTQQARPGQAGQQPFVAEITEILDRAASGHSPTNDQVMAVESAAGLSSGEVAATLVPLLKRALTNPDVAVRQYGLAMLVGIQVLPDSGANATDKLVVKAARSDPTVLTSPRYQPDVARALTPLVPLLAAQLADEHSMNRELAAADLGGFAPGDSPAVHAALSAYLERDDAVGPVGLAVVGDLLSVGPVAPETASAITVFLQRPDQTAESRTSLVEMIAAKPNQSRKINQALISFLDLEDPSLRARVILSLPVLDLPAESFLQLKARVRDIAAVGSQENAEVISAARAIDICWTKVKVDQGCPSN